MKKNILPIAVILAVSIALTAVNYFWIKNNLSHLSPPWDQSAYIYMSLHEYEAIMKGNILQFIDIVIRQAPNLAPLFPFTAIPFLVFFGLDVYTAYLVNSIYMFILLVSVFFITEKIGGRKAASLSVFIVATFPAVIAFSRDYLFEFPLAAMTSLSYLFFLKSESFLNKKYSILFGICAGLSILTKTMGVVFFVLPFLYAVYVLVKTKSARKNIVYAFLSFLIVSAFYYVPNVQHIFGYLFYYGIGQGAKDYNVGVSDLMSFKYWTIYLQHITERGISPLYLVIFIASLIPFLLTRKKELSKDYILVWLWFIAGYILLSIPLNKGGERYALPILPAIAVLTSVHITKLSLKPIRYFFIVAAIAAGVLNYAYQTNSERCMYREIYYKNFPVFVITQISCRMQQEVHAAYDRKWELLPILLEIDNSANRDMIGHVNVLVAVDHHFLNVNSLRLIATLNKLKGESSTEFRFDGVAYKPNDEEVIRQLLDESHFVITKSGYQGPDFCNVNNVMLKDLMKNYSPIKEVSMSDGAIVSLYKYKGKHI